MNRRFLIALAVAVPVAVFIPAKIAASWRPVALYNLVGAQTTIPMTMRVSQRYLVTSDVNATNRFDLQSGEQTILSHGGIAENDAWMANLRAPKYGQLELSLRSGGQTFAYPIPNVTASSIAGYEANTSAQMLSRQTLRIEADRVEFVETKIATYRRWNRRSRQLERDIPLFDITKNMSGFVEEKVAAITRDGERVVTLDSQMIEWRSTLSSQVTQRFRFNSYRLMNQTSEQIQVSNYGAVALYNVWIGGQNSAQWNVISTANGRVLWNFTLASLTNRAVFSSDEKWLALPVDNLRWEIRNAQNGALTRILPRVPNVRAGAFSPDNQTLYSVANGVLYRQRAR